MSQNDRRQAIDDYKNRPLDAGVFAVRCAATGAVWVGANPDLGAARNALWFLLRSGRQRNPTLQAAWHTHGESGLTLDVLEKLDESTLAADVADELKRRLLHWCEALGAERLLR